MGSSQSKPQQQRKPQGQEQSQPQRQRAVLRGKPKYEIHRIQLSDYNVWWLNGGKDGIIDEAFLKNWGCRRCVLCDDKTWTGRVLLIHNIEGCKAAYHDSCMRGYLEDNFEDKKGRLARPKCHVRPIPYMKLHKDKALLRKNPTGYMKF
ncbi:hypothetical protein LTR70_001963 [Exophiala xenobiotica]|uniref:Uncharacterized protein n=1 Tax=Lithohypha guttulata TaxID=1690604 RepID=A0ABR0K9E2_9EURO|nr:hypothetical protein LTR24_005366 [Lithohypha guttulata]KAK5326948.1 hypothetical protein LTR70_001963 [Exophiala xenobiotica]